MIIFICDYNALLFSIFFVFLDTCKDLLRSNMNELGGP